MLFTPFLPFSSQRLHELLGYEGWLAGPLEFREVADEGGGRARGPHRRVRRLDRPLGAERAPAGQELREPAPLFRKLDERVVDEELARMRARR